jgi:hypothetical protein
MAKILYFDCFSGISGDMTLGALLDLGLDAQTVKLEIQKLGVTGYDFFVQKTQKYGISGTDVTVALHEGKLHHLLHKKAEHCEDLCEDFEADHPEEERSLVEITDIINTSGISDRAKALTLSIFEEIARAEATVHGKEINEVHFHEIGAVDSIVDIAGTAICLDLLGVDRIVCSSLHEGRGFVECRHGVLPIPVPAVAQMLQGSGITIVIEDIEAELVTPTGIGIIKTLTNGSEPMPAMTIEKVGYGFGKRDTGKLNALRLFLGTLNEKGDASVKTDKEMVAVLETNIDDMTGEMLGYAMERLFEAGALDVFFTPIQMKKNRPASKLTVLCTLSDKREMAETILRETSTFGLRIHEAERVVMNRRTEILETEFGPIRMKKGSLGPIEKSAPEYEDCARIAREQGLPIAKIYAAVSRLIIDN